MASASDADPEPAATVPRGGRRWWGWLLVPLLLTALIAAALAGGLWYLAETAAGRAWVARQVSGTTLESGLRYEIGRIDGSLLTAFTLNDVTVHDLDGVLATSPRAEIRWEPLALLRNRGLVINRLTVPEIRLLRRWALNPRAPEEPLLPDLDIRVDRFAIGALTLEQPVLGRTEVVGSIGRLDIRSGRLLMDIQASAGRGDRLLLLIDAYPDRDRFDLQLDLRSPADGMLSTAVGQQAPVTLLASGRGSWTAWRGQLDGRIGDTMVASLALAADDGRFRLAGDLAPATLVGEALAPFVSPAIAIDASASRKGDRIESNFVASAPAFALSGSGAINLETSRVEGLRVDALARKPGLLSPGLEAANLRLVATADGPFTDPAIGWRLSADSIALARDSGPVGATGLVAEGRATLPRDARPLGIGFSATAATLTGLDPALAAHLQRPRLAGTLSIAGGNVRLTGGTLTTSSLSASGEALLGADGRLAATVAGGTPSLAIDGLGRVSVNIDARVTRAPGASADIAGGFAVRTLALTSAALADALGGPARIQGQFRLDPSGSIAVSSARFDSPALALANGTARYDPATGRFALDVAGRSTAWGPVAIVASGTTAAPTATVRMASPGLGVGLADLVAEIAPAEGGIAFTLAGSTPQGPLDGQGRLLFGAGEPVVIDLARLRLAGVEARGLLTQSAAGPFVGTLDVAGQGIIGSVRLDDQAGIQRIAVDATARAARIPLATPVQISSGTAALTLLLRPEGAQFAGSFQLSGVRRNTLVLNNAAGRFAIDNGRTVGQVRLSGQSGNGQPFASLVSLQSIPAGYAVMLDGTLGRTPVKLEQAARIVRRAGGGWEVKGTRLLLPGGSIAFAGEWRDPLVIRMVLDDVDLRLLDGLSRQLGLSGTASGQVNIRWDKGYPVPLGAANLAIRNLDRAGVGGVSVPVDIALSARSSTAEGLLVGGAMSWKGNQLGRMLLKVAPAAAEDPVERLLQGTLSGGVRYNGPVEPLFALAGLAGQDLRGPIALAADVGGTVSSPGIVGRVEGRGLVYRNVALGTEISNIAVAGRFRGSELQITSLSGETAGGSLSGSGSIDLAPTRSSIDLALSLRRARLADSDTLSVTLSGPLQLKGSGGEARLSGDLRVDAARIQLVQFETSEVPTLNVRRAGDVRIPPPEQNLSAAGLKLDIKVVADDRIQVEGMGLDSLWRADLRVRGTAAQPMLVGTATLASGDFSFAGSRFAINRGRVVFNGAPLESAISIEAETRAEDVTAFVTIGGTAGRPEVSFRSLPALPEDEILARLLFGTSVAQLSVTEAVQLATAIAGLQSGVDTMGKIRRSVGVDRLRLVGEDAATGMGTGLAIGKRLNRNIYLELLTDSQGNTLATLQWSLSRTLSLLLEISSLGNSSANLRYQREY